MEFYEVINRRRTIRDFSETPIEMDVIKKILSAGLKAPSNDHMRNWEFIVVTDKKKIAEIIQLIPMRNAANMQAWRFSDECQQNMYNDAVPKQYEMLYKSGCLILPFFKQDTPLLKPKTLSSLNAFASIWCCIENILLASASEGLGACIRIPLGNEPQHILNVLSHPKNYVMPCYIALGHPSKNAPVILQKEYSLEEKIHINKW